ncbi:SF1B family DNA helicase RecD2 [Kyrpidia tusciae]|uniref:ATP-dependent RecD2 DNA helicase n=1 Tax=Kyrpidia tusciae (strain DSM 2912 / NBRC 15312 / T2) TaxID=562970 RepID=D5WSU7_KYRT2|nr:ATP-dependent RecD-like DNA helicase [Kyrpidia tusciae]ADG07116.1 helicase, RecD/TraA family [Kyrpidia tusciae DSM 2912]
MNGEDRLARPEAEEVTASGTVERVVFRNEETGFAVFRLKTSEGVISCTGHVYFSQGEGEALEVTGHWAEHPRYGRQLQVTGWNKPLPTDREVAIQLFRRLEGVGRRLARRIVAALGPGAVGAILDHGEAALAGIQGLSPEKAQSIVKQVRAHHGVQKVLGQLMALGISPGAAMRVYRVLGEGCLEDIRRNPYLLAGVAGIGFGQADGVARRLGISTDSPFRLQSALLHTLAGSTTEGHCWLDRAFWLAKTAEMLAGMDGEPWEADRFEGAAGTLAREGQIRQEEDRVYLASLWEAEEQVARWAADRLRVAALQSAGLDDLIQSYERESGVTLSLTQREAVRTAMASPLLILTGGPGTGKTTTVRAILWCRQQLNPQTKVGMAAPTGRAARRLEEVSGFPAATVHRLLGMRVEGIAQFDEENPLPYDLIIVDETSMMDILLADKLVRAAGDAGVILVGDVDQLPSVGPGHVLHDLIQAGVPSVRLDVIFRQARESNIVVNAHRVLQGELPRQGGDFWFVEVSGATTAETNGAIAVRLEQAVQNLLAEGYSPADIQVLSPTKKGELGTEALNIRLQQLMNPRQRGKKEIPFGRKGERAWRVGDKVIQMRNDYEKEVFNGEIGLIEDVDPEEGVLLIRFGDALHEYERDEWDQVRHAYAITIHKSQGGEYPVVLIPMTTSHYILLYRNLLYTGITRAKKLCGLIGMPRALGLAVRNTRPVLRNTRLTEKIQVYSRGRGADPGDP